MFIVYDVYTAQFPGLYVVRLFYMNKPTRVRHDVGQP